MPDTYELDCRLCDSRELFNSTDAVNGSKWAGVSPMSVVSGSVSVHKAYCPAHFRED